MFYLKKSFGKWILKQNRKTICIGTLTECINELVNKNKRIFKCNQKKCLGGQNYDKEKCN